MKYKRLHPPRLAGWILKHSARYDENFSIPGDFDEEFHEIVQANGRTDAWFWYWRHVFTSLPYFIKDIIYWRLIMFTNYMKVAFRSIRKYKGYSFINIAGLAIGMTICVLIMLWVLDELSYDRFHDNADRIYRLCMDADLGTPLRVPVTPTPVGPALVEEFPEVINAVRIGRPGRVPVTIDERQFQEDDVGYADNSFFEIFSFPFISGDPKSALETANTVVITEEMADKYFGNDDPLGKILKIGGETDYTVTGVLENSPGNSHLRFNMLRSFETLISQNRQAMENWLSVQYYNYVLLIENCDIQNLEEKFPTVIDQNMGPILNAIGGKLRLFLQPLTRIRLHSDFERDISSSGDIAYVYLFSGIALFVLLIACFNFINLATARSTTRAMEVGMRKTFGAVRRRLLGQFLGESIFYSLISMILACILLLLSLPFFNNLVDKELSFNILKMPWLLPGLFSLALFVGLIAGSYPAFLLSSFQPVRVLKGSMKTGSSKSLFRSVLVVLQFIISITLIIGTLTIYNQIHYMKNTNLGFNKEQVLVLPRMNDTMRQSYSFIQNELKNIPGVIDVTTSSMVPGRGIMKSVFFPEGFAEDQPQTMDYLIVDHHFLSTMGIEMTAGRNFSDKFATDTSESVIINETAARKFGWEDAIGKRFISRPIPGSDNQLADQNVIGVVRDFHIASLRQQIEPLIIFYDLNFPRVISLRITPDNISQTMERLEEKWKEIDPNRPFNYIFLDETFDSQYRAEERVGNFALYFSLLAIFIGCLGLFGLSSFTAERRTKEIGIRKVLGASVSGIVRLLSKEFLLLVAIANLISWPIAYYAMNRWLENYAYRIGLGWGLFALAAILALFIALLTVSFQAIKAALANPVEAIKYE